MAGDTVIPTSDERDAAYAAVLDRHPDISDADLKRKAERVLAIMRHASDGPRWTVPEHAPADMPEPTRCPDCGLHPDRYRATCLTCLRG